MASFPSKAYEYSIVRSLPPEAMEIIWQKRGPPRVHPTHWFLVRGRLKYFDYLYKLGLITREEANCPWWNSHIETLNHSFFIMSFHGMFVVSVYSGRDFLVLSKEVIPNMLAWSSLVSGKFKIHL